MKIREYREAISEIKVSEETKQDIYKTLVAQADEVKTARQTQCKKYAAIMACALVFICVMGIPFVCLLVPSFSGLSDVPSYGLDTLYVREDGSSVVFDEVSVSNNLTVDGKEISGKFLILSGLFDFHSFSVDTQNDVVMFYEQEEQINVLIFEAELSKSLSSETLVVDGSGIQIDGRICLVFRMTDEQYAIALKGVRGTKNGDIVLSLSECTKRSANATFPVAFTFYFDEIRKNNQ